MYFIWYCLKILFTLNTGHFLCKKLLLLQGGCFECGNKSLLSREERPPLYAKRTASRSFLGAPYLHIEGLHKAEGRLRRGTEGASSLQRPSRSFVEGSENPSLRTTYLAAFCAKERPPTRLFRCRLRMWPLVAAAVVWQKNRKRVCVKRRLLFSRNMYVEYNRRNCESMRSYICSNIIVCC